ncbi:hypothetical protein ACFX1X_032781 [Malus domestica]
MFSKQGKSSFCHLVYPCINSTKGTRAPKARTCDHPASLRAPRKESPRKYSGSMFSDADSSGSSAMQVMTTEASSINE